MKNKTLFYRIISLIIVAIVCLLLTITVAVLAGSLNVELFDFSNLNFSNMLPVLIIGAFISCVIVGICFLFVARTAFFKAKSFLEENQNNNKKGETK